MSNNSDCLYDTLRALQRVEMPAPDAPGEGARILREKLTESRILYNTMFATQYVGDMAPAHS